MKKAEEEDNVRETQRGRTKGVVLLNIQLGTSLISATMYNKNTCQVLFKAKAIFPAGNCNNANAST